MTSATQTLRIIIQVLDKGAATAIDKVGSKLTTLETSMKGFTKASRIDVFNKNLGMAGMKMDKMGKITDMSTGKMVTMESAANRVNMALGRGVQQIRTFDMRLLSVMFGGMALARAFGGITRGIVTTFLKAEDKTSGLAKATTRLSAGWEYMKFSIMDALNTDFFIAVIDNVIRFLDWISALINKFPILGQAMFITFGALAVGGTIMMIIAQFKLFWDATFGVGGFLAKKMIGTTGAVKGLNTALVTTKATASGITFGGLITALGGLAIAAAGVYAAMKLIDSLIAQFTEPEGAPPIEDVAAHPIDNIKVLGDAIGGTTQEFSNMRAGMDSTMQIMSIYNEDTEKMSSHILTQDDIIQGLTSSGENFLTGNKGIVGYNPTVVVAFDGLTDSIKRQADAYRELARAKRAAASAVSEYYAGEDVDFYTTESSVSGYTGEW